MVSIGMFHSCSTEGGILLPIAPANDAFSFLVDLELYAGLVSGYLKFTLLDQYLDYNRGLLLLRSVVLE
jgi:hypothetical protein